MREKTVKLDPKDIRELERIGAAKGVTVHALMRQFIRWGIRAVTGTLEDELELERQRLDLDSRRAAILQTAVTKDREKSRKKLPPYPAIIAAYTAGDGKGAVTYYRSLDPDIRGNVLRRMQREMPEIAERLQAEVT
jgi:hypothetical protein